MVEVGGDRRRAGATTWPPRRAASPSAGAYADDSIWRGWLAHLQSWLRAEAGAGRLTPWIPVAFGTGVALYFAAEREPVAGVAGATALALCAIAIALRRTRAFVSIALLAAIASGFAAATLKAARVAHGVLARPIYTASIKGFVETREERERTDRFVLRVTSMDAPRRQEPLTKVRLSGRRQPRRKLVNSSS